MHKLLARQLKKTYGRNFDLDSASAEFKTLLDSVSDAYGEYNNERKFLEHTIEKNSQELTSANRLISDQNNSLTHQLKAISRSRAFLTRLIDSVHMYIVTSNTQLDVISVNKKFSESLNKRYHHFFELFSELLSTVFKTIAEKIFPAFDLCEVFGSCLH